MELFETTQDFLMQGARVEYMEVCWFRSQLVAKFMIKGIVTHVTPKTVRIKISAIDGDQSNNPKPLRVGAEITRYKETILKHRHVYKA